MTPPGITAPQWIERAFVDRQIFRRWPDYRLFLVATDHVDTSPLVDVATRLLANAEEAVRTAPVDHVDPHVTRWHDAYRDFGTKPRVARVSVDALIRRARSDSRLPRINTLVNLYNAISIQHRVPIGGEDLDHYDGPPRLILATGDETFPTTANGQPVVDHPEPGEPVWTDGIGVTCRRWNWRQTARTAITPNTRRVGFIIDSLAPPHHDARRAADQLAELLPDTTIRTVDTDD
jgi:DNA/RNA-binding domain of Phe-tRNA-synthetase-like protein